MLLFKVFSKIEYNVLLFFKIFKICHTFKRLINTSKAGKPPTEREQYILLLSA